MMELMTKSNLLRCGSLSRRISLQLFLKNGKKTKAAENSNKSSLKSLENDFTIFHKPGENHKAKNYITTSKTATLLKEHLIFTKGQVRTRFPPDPNGFLHIGHAKAININFSYAAKNNGVCILRFDDTNPENAKQIYVDEVRDVIKWLGFKPLQETYTSDYFKALYAYAIELINSDLAYVCHGQMSNFVSHSPSPWRERPKHESLELFEKMRKGEFGEREAVLRMKFTTDQGTVDPIAYRIKYFTHFRTGNEWCIFPTYDFSHSLCDSLENITHSFCSFEFSLRRSTYYWVCNSLNVYCPVQTEYGRLNILHSVVSKREMKKLIQAKVVTGWDDPRLYTLSGLRRRGVPATAINKFCHEFKFNPNSIFMHPEDFNYYIRKDLMKTAVRIMVVLEPLKVILTDFPQNEIRTLTVPNIPGKETAGTHTIKFAKEIWIERSDFKEIADNNFYRLTSSQPVGLKHTSSIIKVQDIITSNDGTIDCLYATLTSLRQAETKPKAFIHWVSQPMACKVRIFNNLFYHPKPTDPKQVPDELLSDVRNDSVQEFNALGDSRLLQEAQQGQVFQFERLGFFCVDYESKQNLKVFNLTVSLKQDKGFDKKSLST